MGGYSILQVPKPGVAANIAASRKRNLPSALEIITFPRWTIVGGGPSLKHCTPDGIIVCVNGAHDFLLAQGIVPWACVLMDSDPIIGGLVTPDSRVIYLVASQCHPSVFDKLPNAYIWHAWGNVREHFESSDYPLIGGGSTAALRCLPLGYALGVREFEIYGLDSSYESGKHHAYPSGTSWDHEIEVVYPGKDGERSFRTSRPLAIQAKDFIDNVKEFKARAQAGDADEISLAVHGDGLIPYIWKTFTTET